MAESVKNIIGKKPLNIELFKLSFRHTSVAEENGGGIKESNERLEYLGDAILGAVVADFLFRRFPYKNEGFLTEIRSRLVSREALNILARKIGLDNLVRFDSKRKTRSSFKYVYGDAMEAFVGAVFLDRGFKFCRKFIVRKLLNTYTDLEEVVNSNSNYKSRLIEWSQKNNRKIKFEILDRRGNRNRRQFSILLTVDEVEVSRGNGFSKKKAEQDAARRALEVLIPEIPAESPVPNKPLR